MKNSNEKQKLKINEKGIKMGLKTNYTLIIKMK